MGQGRRYSVSVKSHSRRPRKGGKRARKEHDARTAARHAKHARRRNQPKGISKRSGRVKIRAGSFLPFGRKKAAPKRRSGRKRKGRNFLGDFVN